MLGGIFHKRKKSQELRSPSLQDLKKFRDAYAKYAEIRQVESPPCFEKVTQNILSSTRRSLLSLLTECVQTCEQSIYKAIAGQKDLHSVELKQEDITDPQMIALAEALLEMPIISSLDLRDNRITDDGAKALLEVLRLQIIEAKTPPTADPRTKQSLYPPLPEYTRYITNVNLKGNEVSSSVLKELSQYIDILRREDKRLEIRAALHHIDRNNDGSIDEEEFKGVLKLLTASTPTKKEIRAFMQQHTLSTDRTQNVINLENVLLAKCAVSPSRHAACPPWEALVQERHAILGAPRMMAKFPESTSAKAPYSRPSLPSSDSGLANSVNSVVHSNSTPDISPSASPTSQIAPVAPLEMPNPITKPPPAPLVSVPAVPSQPQYITKVSESKSASMPSESSASSTKPPAIPILPLASVMLSSVSPSPRSARSSVDDEGQLHPSLIREGGLSSIISAPSSPHDSDISDNMSVVSSAFGGSVSQRVVEDHDHTSGPERKLPAVSAVNSAATNLDSPRWQSENLSVDDDEVTSSGGLSGAREEVGELSSGEGEDDTRSGYSHKPPKSVVASSASKSLSSVSRRESSFPENETPRDPPARSEYSSAGHDEKSSLPASVVSTPRFDDLSSLVYRGAEEVNRSTFLDHSDKADFPSGQPEEDEEVEDQVDSLVFDVTKDGKERYVVKLVHSEFRSGLTVTDFPAELPFRNLVALLLPENGLSDLALFAECRFPFVLVLDLSRNKLTKLADESLTAFPRLEVLNLASNQLKTISGLTKVFKLRALGLSHNSIRTVKNVEHLVQLEILQLASNQIATVHALRLLSLNNVLAHLNLDGNPVVETDERQKRKNIVHVRNLLPALQSLGSIPCAGLKDKKKLSSSTNPGKCLFESDLIPDYKSLWVSTACDELHILQDATSHSSHQSQHDDDEWDTRNEDEDADRPKKPLTREQQRQKDELRSRAIGFRSRGKAIPSPQKVKSSVYCFGPPQPASKKKKAKKPAPADPSVVREQQRRASELSAPKHGPVDKGLMQQEQKRKSRVDFHAAMTVAERLQLALDMTQRRPTATVGLSARSRSILAKADSRKQASTTASIIEKEGDTEPEVSLQPTSRSPSPQRPSPMKDAMVFRIDPANTPRSPKGALTFRVDPYPAGLGAPSSTTAVHGSKEAEFLHDLAVSDFLNHEEEEFSTALTALNVLLSMSEKEQGDRKKLADYRASLDALDILNEHESHELFKKTQGHPEHELQAQCTEWFIKLGVVKKCMRQLLEKLEVHAPGSRVIRAYCRYIRSNELQGIISTVAETQEDGVSQEDVTTRESGTVGPTKDDVSHEHEQKPPQSDASVAFDEKSNQADTGFDSVTSHAFTEPEPAVPAADSVIENTNSVVDENPQAGAPYDHGSGDNDLDFLESNDSVFHVEKEEDPQTVDTGIDDTSFGSLHDPDVDVDPVLLAATTDITMDIQMNGASDLLDGNYNADDMQWTEDAVEDDQNGTKTSDGLGDDDRTEESAEVNEDETLEQSTTNEVETPVFRTQAAASADENYDWLASSSDLQAETNETDSFEQEMDGVSEDEAEVEAGLHEQTEANQNDDWTSTEIPIEEEVEMSEDVVDGEPIETYDNEEGSNHDVYEQGEYDEHTEVGTEEAVETQFELGDGVDADDEEAETFGDWEKGFDPNSNHYFWFNHSTGESSWTAPEGWPYEVDEPFSTEEAVDAEEEQQEQVYEEGAAESQEYDAAATEGQEYEAEGQYYEEGAAEDQYDVEGDAEGQYYEESTNEGEYYHEGAVEGEYYEEGAVDTQEYQETPAEGQEYEEDAAEEQQQESTTDGQWYDETAVEGQEYVSEDQAYEVAVDDDLQVEQAGEESPRRSEVSDFEFDDSDLPGF